MAKIEVNEDVQGYEHAFDVWWECIDEGHKVCKAKFIEYMKAHELGGISPRLTTDHMATSWESFIDYMWYLLKKGRQSSRRLARTRGVDNIRTYTKKKGSVEDQVNKALGR